jgi:KDO2-lipid IV(A) lauroyltransferase
MRDRLVEWGYLAAWRTVRLAPERPTAALFRAAADRAWRKNGKAVQRLRRNLSRVVDGEVPETLVRDAMRSYARYWLEAFRLPSMSSDDIHARFEMRRFEPVAERARQGLGSVVALPHCANWDLAGAWVGIEGHRLTTVAERLKPEGVFRRFIEYRTSLGMNVVPFNGGDRNPQSVLTERAAAGDVVALVADRDLGRNGIDVKFFGEPTTFPSGPALLAIRAGVPLYTAALYYEPDRVVCTISDPIPTGSGRLRDRLSATTQAMADAFAAGIAAHPVDWHMLQPLWSADRPAPES